MAAPASDNAMGSFASIAFKAGNTESCMACANFVQSAGSSAISFSIKSGARFTLGSLLLAPGGATCLPGMRIKLLASTMVMALLRTSLHSCSVLGAFSSTPFAVTDDDTAFHRSFALGITMEAMISRMDVVTRYSGAWEGVTFVQLPNTVRMKLAEIRNRNLRID